MILVEIVDRADEIREEVLSIYPRDILREKLKFVLNILENEVEGKFFVSGMPLARPSLFDQSIVRSRERTSLSSSQRFMRAGFFFLPLLFSFFSTSNMQSTRADAQLSIFISSERTLIALCNSHNRKYIRRERC